MKFCPGFMTLLAAVFLFSTAALAANVSLTPSGDGRFSVNGSAMDGVAGIDLAITYDSSMLSAPVVTQGGLISGAIMVANTSTPGIIKVAIITQTTPFSGSGQIVALTFSGKSGSGGITSINARLIDSKGTTLQTNISFTPDLQAAGSGATSPAAPPAHENQATGQQQQPATASGTATAGAAAPSIGTLTLPGEGKQPETPPMQEPPLETPPQQEQIQSSPATVAPAEEPPAAEVKTTPPPLPAEIVMTGYTSVLERFKTFKGERKIAAFAELFTTPVAAEAKQQPEIAVSDGTQVVRILAGFTSPDINYAPNFAAADASVISVKPEENSGRWIIALKPAQDSLKASVSILLGNRLFEVPLVIVPPTRNLTFSEKEIGAFLKDYAAEKPEFDLDGDGRHDYLDDYIYTGHYLLRKIPQKT